LTGDGGLEIVVREGGREGGLEGGLDGEFEDEVPVSYANFTVTLRE
jgi:hypothetical protein